MTNPAPSHKAILTLAIASIINRFEFELMALDKLIDALPNDGVRDQLIDMRNAIGKATDEAKSIRP